MSNPGLAVAGGCQYPSVTPAAVLKGRGSWSWVRERKHPKLGGDFALISAVKFSPIREKIKY